MKNGVRMLKGFREFIMRGNVIDLAVAVVIGAAFTAVVNSIVTNLFNPLIGALFRAESVDSALVVAIPTLGGGAPAELRFGAVVGAILSFVIVAAVVYFVFVLPVNTLRERTEARLKRGDGPAPSDPETELTVLAQIRDLLAAQAEPAAPRGRHEDSPPD